MKIAICYYSRHHGNTLKVIEAMTAGQEVDLIDVTVRVAVHLEQYDLIGFASGIYYNKYSDAVVSFARQYLPENKKVFFIYTYGAPKVTATKEIAEAVAEKQGTVIGEYSCRGFDTFGPFKLVGGIAKGHPTAGELAASKEFFRNLMKQH
ncbi:flavodoxin family protein [Oscillibacter ruminantium]|uniref:flavodoxin family protein n=1 Tax=Oscillibacter ruminantium TaxID=1263547 RepID=UPI0003160A85|nr:flavodoxin family protein [Oscillibacter ruminantium]